MAGPFDDEEEVSGPATVGAALLGSEESAPPEEVPNPVEGGTKTVSVPDQDAQNLSNYTVEDPANNTGAAAPDQEEKNPYIDQQPPEALYTPSPDEPTAEQDVKPTSDQETAALAQEAPINAPEMPQFGKYIQSQAPAAMQAQKASENPAAYKPSKWRRALAGIAGGLTAAGSRDSAAGMRVADEVLNQPKNRVTADWKAKEDAITAQQQADEQKNQTIHSQNTDLANQYNMQERDMRNRGYVANQNAQAATRNAQAQQRLNAPLPNTLRPVDPNDPLGEWTGTNAQGKVVRGLSAPDSYLKTPAGQSAVAIDKIKKLQAAGVKLTPEQQAVVGSGGKLTVPNRTNIHMPSAQSEQYQDWKHSLGHAPTPDEIMGFVHHSSTQDPDAIVAASVEAKQAYADQFKRNNDGSYENEITGAVIPGKEFNDKIEKFRTDANVKLQKSGYQMDAQGNVVSTNAPRGTQQPGAPPPQQAAPPAQGAPAATKVQSGATVKVGDPISVNGRKGTVAGINPKNGKIIPKWD